MKGFLLAIILGIAVVASFCYGYGFGANDVSKGSGASKHFQMLPGAKSLFPGLFSSAADEEALLTSIRQANTRIEEYEYSLKELADNFNKLNDLYVRLEASARTTEQKAADTFDIVDSIEERLSKQGETK